MMLFSRKGKAAGTVAGPAIVPLMDGPTMSRAMQSSPGGQQGLALLQYDIDTFEMVSGKFSVIVEDSGVVGYWLGDRLVGLLGKDGVPQPVPALRSLRLEYVYPLHTLTTDRIPAAS